MTEINKDPELVEDEKPEAEVVKEIELPDYDNSLFVLPDDFEFEDDD